MYGVAIAWEELRVCRTVRKAWTGCGVGDGCGDGVTCGDVTTDGDVVGLTGGWTPAAVFVQAARTMSVINISAKRWALEIRPERGGRITSLRLDGEELLDQ